MHSDLIARKIDLKNGIILSLIQIQLFPKNGEIELLH